MFLHGHEHTVFDVSTGREAIGGADAIAGDGGFTKIRAGTLVLRTINSYSGGTIRWPRHRSASSNGLPTAGAAPTTWETTSSLGDRRQTKTPADSVD
jgi:autotransporter-associated beta strand protein